MQKRPEGGCVLRRRQNRRCSRGFGCVLVPSGRTTNTPFHPRACANVVGAARLECDQPATEVSELIRRQLRDGFTASAISSSSRGAAYPYREVLQVEFHVPSFGRCERLVDQFGVTCFKGAAGYAAFRGRRAGVRGVT
jgi:hypothetical protein